jgi:hypothetical protein
MITNDARCASEIKFRIAMAKTAFNRKTTVFTNKLDLKCKASIEFSVNIHIALTESRRPCAIAIRSSTQQALSHIDL